MDACRCYGSVSSGRISLSIVLGEGGRTDDRSDDGNSKQLFHGGTPYSFMMANDVMTVAQQHGHDKSEHRETCDLFR
jgi:hypothetical protein